MRRGCTMDREVKLDQLMAIDIMVGPVGKLEGLMLRGFMMARDGKLVKLMGIGSMTVPVGRWVD